MMASVADTNETLTSGQRFGRLLDTLSIPIEARGHQVARVLVPFSPPTARALWGNPSSYNRKYFLACLRDAVSLTGSRVFHREAFFAHLLDAIQPRVVFTIGGPTALRVMCQRRAIPCVEIAHGGGDVEQLISEGKTPPSHIVTFDPQRCSQIKSSGTAVVLECEPFWDQATSCPCDGDWSTMPNFVEPPPASDSLPNVLFTTSWFGAVPRAVWDAINTSQETARWFIRMHPVLNGPGPLTFVLRKVLEFHVSRFSNAEVKLSSTCPLPRLLKNVSHHITFSSATCYEAARFGIPSLALSPQDRKGAFHDLRKEGFVSYSTDFPTILEWISASRKLEPRLRKDFGKPLSAHFDLLGL